MKSSRPAGANASGGQKRKAPKRPPASRKKISRVVIVTGLSGSGKTVAMRALEDLDYFCVDNLPVSLIEKLLPHTAVRPGGGNTAIGIDIRDREFLEEMDSVLGRLRKKHNIEVLYLEADPGVLIRRYKETRRPHPLGGDIEQAIKSERKSLSELRSAADRVIDTSSYSPHQLRELVSSLYCRQAGRRKPAVTLMSFGFKYGAPQNVDLLFDVRFLPNPFFVASLKHLNGADSRVSDYVFSHPETDQFMAKLGDMIGFLLPRYIREGRSYIAIAVGCTGGNHRSPAIVEKLADMISGADVELAVVHRDMA